MLRRLGRSPQREEKTEKALTQTRQAWFSKVRTLFDRPDFDDRLWEELEDLLLAADVGPATSNKLVSRLEQRVRDSGLTRAAQVREALKEEMVALLPQPPRQDPPGEGEQPRIVLLVGVNGVGKTTCIAKLAHAYQVAGHPVLLAAADTYRAAAREQLERWAQRVGAPVIVGRSGSDPAAVAFDAAQAASARRCHVLLVDTAGRMQTNHNLMQELQKIRRVLGQVNPSAPHEVLLVLDATTGQNGLSQAQHFAEAVGITGVFLTKLDGTAKGGVVLAIADTLGVPVVYVGTGEGLDDIADFDPKSFVAELFR